MKAFYSDTFVLPLPEAHRFPMAKCRLLRDRLVEEGVLSVNDLHVPEPIAWDDLRLVHDAAYVDAVAHGTLPADAQRRIDFPWSPMMVERSRRSVGATLAGGTHHAFRDRNLPVVVAMSGGYAPDVDAIVTIHTNTIREAIHSCLSVSVF